ncbi:MAG: SipW-dependent-type signal peptide-containing protein [Clostridia bacterium]|nr:SipW-dependent-type signal peptide-containing protein [Clostridia bacterium]
MTKKNATKKALLMSLLSLLLCVSMLVGTTFAWFTDSVTSAGNIIKAGNLDIEMEWKDATATGKQQSYLDASKGPIFHYELWEPGYVEAKNVNIKNVGSLALKYALSIVPTGEVSALANVIDVYYADGEITLADRAMTELTKVGTLAEVLSGMPANMNGTLKAGDNVTVTIALKMREEAGNEYQGLAIGSSFAVKLFATQLMHESDSFGSDYDKNAPWTGEVDTAWYDASEAEFVLTSAEELAGLASLVNSKTNHFQNKTVKLGADINLSNLSWTPIGSADAGFQGTFDGDGHTVSNLYVEADNNAGLFGYALNGGNVKNLTVENAYVKANDYAGAIMGRGYTDIDNCHVKNATVITTPYLMDDGVTYDGGAKAGGIIGQLLEGAGNTVTNCSATGVKIYGFRDLGGVVGMVHNNNACSDNTATDVTVGYVLFDKITADENENAGAIYGRVQSSATVSPAKDSTENLSFTQVYVVYDALSLKSLSNFVNGVSTAYNQDSFKNQTIVLIDDVDLKGEAFEPIGKTFNQFEFKGHFDGQGHTVSNFTVSNKQGAALFGFVRRSGASGATLPGVKNLTVKNVVANGGDYVGGVVGQLYGTVENCHAINVTATATPFLLSDGVTYDGGAKAGGVIGWIESGAIYSASDCTARNVTIKAYRDLGGVIGMAHNNNVITNCKCYDSKLSYGYLASTDVYSGNTPNGNIGEVIGRRGTGVTETGTYFENVTLN